MTYAKYSDTCVLRVNDFKYINKEQTDDWQAYEAWLASGKVPLDGNARCPDPVPSVQIRATDANMARIVRTYHRRLIRKGVIACLISPSVQDLLSRRQALRAAIASE
jgi:hypothetical protein